MAVDKDKNTQVLVTFPNEMIEHIEEFWFRNKIKNRNEAIRQLVSIALEQEKRAEN